MKKHNVRRLLVLVLVVALCLLCGAAAQPNPEEIRPERVEVCADPDLRRYV